MRANTSPNEIIQSQRQVIEAATGTVTAQQHAIEAQRRHVSSLEETVAAQARSIESLNKIIQLKDGVIATIVGSSAGVPHSANREFR